MSLDELPASELGRLDSICLEFEARLRAGRPQSIDEVVDEKGGRHASILRRELEAIRAELSDNSPTQLAPSSSSPLTPPSTPLSTHSAFPPSSNRSESPRAGANIGPYVIGGILGRGGMGVVYKAIDPRLDRVVAIKVFSISDSVGAAKKRNLSERFDREAKAVAALSHPNIVELFDVGVNTTLPYAVMEYLDGELLDQRFQRGGMSPGEVRRLGAQIADALAAAHSGGVIHRDLKPHNIMLVRRKGGDGSVVEGAVDERGNHLDANGTSRGDDSDRGGKNSSDEGAESTVVKLFDFGLSRIPRPDIDSADETSEGTILGTPGYMAPEQARGESVSSSADIFSLGCVLYEAFYGQRAFGGDTSAQRFRATIDHTPEVDPIRRRDDVALADLIERCLQKQASDRPQFASEVATLLRHRESKRDSLFDMLGSGYSAGEMVRRRALAVLAGGVAGGIAGAFLNSNAGNEIGSIRSLAVLSFRDLSPDQASPPTRPFVSPEPIGEKDLDRGEMLSALLVHELTRLSELSVPRFRPMTAESPNEFRILGRELEVDAVLIGSIYTVEQGASRFLVVDIQIISTDTGSELWGKQIQTDAADNYLQQSKLATEIAIAIGQRLTSTAEEAAPPSVESFSCLVDGKTRADPESIAGLKKALMCFERAHEVDRRFADPLAGIALTSITLAAQSTSERSFELIIRARETSAEALAMDPTLVDARLATAMLDWQTTNRYEQAERAFRELTLAAPNNWQVLYQHGLLQLTTGQTAKASKSLREASQLNPWSVLAKVDRARAIWFSGNAKRAIEDALRIRDKYNRNPLARGLLVDIYESQHRFDDAIAQHDRFEMAAGASETDYLRKRREYLAELPYGPFGAVMNEAIWQSRRAAGIDERRLAEIADSSPPMFPLLLAAHPSFSAVRRFERAKEILPASRAESLP